jgi:hypothetical protein
MSYEELIQNLRRRSLTVIKNDPQQFERWQLHLLPDWIEEILPTINPDECVAFICDHKEYSFVSYDAFGKVCGKPRELAAYLLAELVKELVAEEL